MTRCGWEHSHSENSASEQCASDNERYVVVWCAVRGARWVQHVVWGVGYLFCTVATHRIEKSEALIIDEFGMGLEAATGHI